jgi:hypothetical protein
MLRSSIFILCCCCFTICAKAQIDIAIGQWKSYLPYRGGIHVTQSDERVFYATDFSVLAIDKGDFAVEYFSKVNGLSGVGVRTIEYNKFGKQLIVVYKNGVIDIIDEKGTKTLNQIKNFNAILGEKVIAQVYTESASTIYIAANYGISKINTQKAEFEFTTFTGLSVNNIIQFQNQIYIATNEGVYTTSAENSFAEDFSTWEWLGQEHGFPAEYSTTALSVYDNKIYLDVNDTLFYFDNNQLTLVYQESGFDMAYLSNEGKHLIAGWTRGTGTAGKVLYFTSPTQYKVLPNDCFFNPYYAVEDNQKEGAVWFADQAPTFYYLENRNDANCKSLNFNSPYTHYVQEITVAADALWLASGGVNPTFSPLLRSDGFSQFKDNTWQTFNQFITPALIGKPLWDFLKVVVHPENGKVYAGAYIEGLVEWDGQKFIIYDDSNSSLGNAVGDASRTRVSGLAFDAENNLWISNYGASVPISVFTKDNTWQNFSTRGSCRDETALWQVLVDRNGYKWFIVTSGSAGLLVYDEGESLENTNDDRCKLFTSTNSSLPTNKVNALALDLNGDIWVGTSEGVAVFQCFDPFEQDCDFFLPKTDQDENNLGLLLKAEDVRTVAVDGANRKWFGTTNGIFVQSPDGAIQEARFTAENSPLFDNTITDIEINQQTGEVFIGTAQGFISYRGEATAGGTRNSVNAYAFPNPVRPEYEGNIAIAGLAENANVKITDVTGQLIFETTALGGQAIWNGKDYNGKQATSGVYLVFATGTNSLQPDAIVTKILILR